MTLSTWERVVLGLAGALALAAAVARPAFRLLDERVRVAEHAFASLDELGVALDPWGAPVLHPRMLRDFTGAQPQGVVEARQHHLDLEVQLLALADQSDVSAVDARLRAAAEVAAANAAREPKQRSFPLVGPAPYQHVDRIPWQGADWIQGLESYSSGPNRIDELGHGDDAVFQVAFSEVYERWVWFWPLVAAAWLLGVWVYARALPRLGSARSELAVGLALGALYAATAWFARGELFPKGSAMEDLSEGVRPAAYTGPELAVALTLGLCSVLLWALLRTKTPSEGSAQPDAAPGGRDGGGGC